MYRPSFVILYYQQQMHNYFTNYGTGTCFDTIMSPSGSLKSIPCQVTQVFQMQLFFFFLWRCGPTRAMASFLRFLVHTQWRITVGRSPLDEWSARRKDLYLTTHNHNRQISMRPVGFEPTISTGERPQTHVLDRAATGIFWHDGTTVIRYTV